MYVTSCSLYSVGSFTLLFLCKIPLDLIHFFKITSYFEFYSSYESPSCFLFNCKDAKAIVKDFCCCCCCLWFVISILPKFKLPIICPHERLKVKVLVAQSYLTLCNPMDCSPSGRRDFLCPWDFTGKKYWSGLPFPSLVGLPNSGIKPRSASLQANFLPSEPWGKPKRLIISLLIWMNIILSTKVEGSILEQT